MLIVRFVACFAFVLAVGGCGGRSETAPRRSAALAPATQTATQAATQAATQPAISTEYGYLKFAADERWTTRVEGPATASKWEGKRWSFDFSSGAKSIGLIPADISMLGEPEDFCLVVRGDSAGHPLRINLATHFMYFERTLDPVVGDGLHEIRFAAPPGEGWKWFYGENDGKIHGPVRLKGIYIDGAGKGGSGTLEMVEMRVKAKCAADRTSLMTARVVDGKSPQFVMTLQSQAPRPMDARVDCVIRDWEGRTVATHSQPVRIDIAKPCEVPVPVPAGERVFLEAEFTCHAAGQSIPSTTVSRVAKFAAGGSDRLLPTSPWGLGLYLHRYDKPEQMTRAAEMARDMGVKWSREEFGWAVVEPRKGEYHWDEFDRVIATAKKHGISVYVLLDYWSPWTNPYTPEGIKEYCGYVRAVVQRYKNDVHHWEVWNEPNIFFWQGPKEMYADLLKAAYKTIKEVDPEAQVAGCSTSGIDSKFIEGVLKAQAPFDLLTIHPYRRNLVDLKLIQELRDVAKLVERPDGTRRPVWVTEIGWGTHAPHNAIFEGPSVTPRQQACNLVRAYVDGLASGVVQNFSWYDFRNDGTNPLEWEDNFGIVMNDFQPKPAYRAYATMVKLLGEKPFDKQVDAGEGVLAFRFGKGADWVTVAWVVDQAHTITLETGGAALLTNLMGESRKLRAEGGSVRVELQAGTPVFVTPVP